MTMVLHVSMCFMLTFMVPENSGGCDGGDIMVIEKNNDLKYFSSFDFI